MTSKPIMKTLSNRAVGKLTVEKDTVFWDRDLTGFGVRVYPTGSKVYVAQARGPEGPRRVAVGRHGVIHAEEARKRAALVIARIKAGEEAIPKPRNPAGGPTVAELAKRYLAEYVSVRCKPSTAKTVRSVVLRHIVPALENCPSHRRAQTRGGTPPEVERHARGREPGRPGAVRDVPLGLRVGGWSLRGRIRAAPSPNTPAAGGSASSPRRNWTAWERRSTRSRRRAARPQARWRRSGSWC